MLNIKNLNFILLFIGILYFPESVFSDKIEKDSCLHPHLNRAIEKTGKELCEITKASYRCQNLYKEIQANFSKNPGFYDGLESKKLRCDIDFDLTFYEYFSVRYLSCLKGGIEGAITGPIHEFGQWIGESAGAIVMAYNKNKQQMEECNQNPTEKTKRLERYNSRVPQLLKLDPPPKMESISCAALETYITKTGPLKEDMAFNKYGHLSFQTKKGYETRSEDKNIQEYISWYKRKNEFSKMDGNTLLDLAKSELEKYGIHLECYNIAAQSVLICETLAQILTSGVGGAYSSSQVISKVSGLKVEKFVSKANELLSAPGGLKMISNENKLELLKYANTLTDKERITATELLLNRTLDETQTTALIKAHQEPLTNLRKKAKILNDAKFSQAERDVLMRTGITGEFDDYLNAARTAERIGNERQANIVRLEREILLHEKLIKESKDPKIQEKLNAELTSKKAELEKLNGDKYSWEKLDIEAQIGKTTRTILETEATEKRANSVQYSRRSNLLSQHGDTLMADKSISAAQRAYKLSADDINTVVQRQELTSGFKDLEAIRALRTLSLAGKDAQGEYFATFNKLVDQIARSKMSLEQVQFTKLPVNSSTPQPVQNALDKVLEFREQSIRIEIQRTRNENKNRNWESDTRINSPFMEMVDKREETKSKADQLLVRAGVDRKTINMLLEE